MAIERDTDKKLTVGSVKAAKKQEQKLTAMKPLPVPKTPGAPIMKQTVVNPNLDLRKMQTGIDTAKLAEIQKTGYKAPGQKFTPVQPKMVKNEYGEEIDSGEFEAKHVFGDYEIKPDASLAKYFAESRVLRTDLTGEQKKKALLSMTEKQKKTIYSWGVANGYFLSEDLSPEIKAERDKYAGADYYRNKENVVKQANINKRKAILQAGAKQPLMTEQSIPSELSKEEVRKRIDTALSRPTITPPTVSGRGMNPRALPLNLTPQQQEQQRQQYAQELQRATANPNIQTKIAAGIASGLTAGISEAGMTPEQRARYQQTVGTGIPYMVGQGIGMIGGGGIAEGALRTGGKLAANVAGKAGTELAKQVARGAIIGGTQQGVMSATERKTPIQIAQDVALTAGLGAVADVGLNKLLGAIAKKYGSKAVTPEIQQAIENETRTLIDQNGYKVMSDGSIFKDGKLLKKSAKVREAGKVSEPIQMGVRGRLPEGTMKPEVGLGKSKISTIPGKYEVTSKPYMQAITDEIEKVQNFYGHSDILGTLADRYRLGISKYDPSTMDWKDIVKAETGVNVNNIEKGLDPVKLSEIGKEIRLARAAGVAPNIRIAKEKIELAPKPLIPKGKQVEKPFALTPAESQRIKSPTTAEKPLGSIETLPTGKKQIEPIVEPTATNIDERTGFKIPKAEIQAEKSKMGGKISDLWDKFYSRFVNYNAPLKKLGGEALQTATVNKASTSGIIENILTNALVDAKGNKIGKSLKEVYRGFPHGENADLFEQYMRHKNNIDRAKTITKEVPYIKDGKPVINPDGTPKTRTEIVKDANPVYPDYTSEESAAWVKKMDELHPDWSAKQKEVTNWIDTFMKEWSVNRQLISPEDYQNLRNMYQNYVPTNREFSQLEKNALSGVSGSKGFADQPGVIKSATGSNRNITPTIENIMNMVNRTVSIAKKNEVVQKILKATRENPNNLIKILSDAEAETANKNMNNIVSVFENGKRTYMQVNDPEIMRAINGMNNTSGDTLKIIKKLTQGYKALITTKNVLFTVPNAVRDIQSSFINGTEKNPVKFANDLWNSYVDIVKNKEGFQQYKGLGGIGGNFTADKTKEFAKSMVKDPSLFIRALNGIEGFNNIVESAPRYAEFKRVLKATGDPQKALYAGYDITTNFSRGGDVTKQWDAFIPYLNAGVQGLDKMARQFGKHPFLTFAKGAGAITIPSIVLNEINKNNPNYQNLDNRTRDNYFVFSNPLGPKDENGYPTTFIKLPKERQMGMLFGSLVDRVYSGDFKDYGANTIANMAPTNPLTSNLAAPLYGLKANKSFTGADIVPRSLQGLSPHLQYDEKTSEIAKGIASLANKAGVELSPKQLDYLIKSYTGVIAQIGLPATTKSTYSGTSDVKNLMKPVVSRFTADVAYNNKLVGNFYDNLDEINKKVADAKKLNPQLFPKGFKSPTQVIQSVMGKYSDQISEMNKKAAAETDPNKQREYRMKALEIAKKANEYYQQAKSKLGAK